MRLFVIVFIFINQALIYSQNHQEPSESLLINQIESVNKELKLISKDTLPREWIIYSIDNYNYHIAVERQEEQFSLSFFRTLKSDTIPVLLFYSFVPNENEDFKKLFSSWLYWEEAISYHKNYKYTDAKVGNTKSAFYYFDKEDNVIAEFQLPTFINGINPLEKSHRSLLDLRMRFILRYVMNVDYSICIPY